MLIPPVMPRADTIPQTRGKPVDYYEISMKQIEKQILPTPFSMTTVWGYGGKAAQSNRGLLVHNAPAWCANSVPGVDPPDLQADDFTNATPASRDTPANETCGVRKFDRLTRKPAICRPTRLSRFPRRCLGACSTPWRRNPAQTVLAATAIPRPVSSPGSV
jgi:hypothetical protein